jgi:hypothetical protein
VLTRCTCPHAPRLEATRREQCTRSSPLKRRVRIGLRHVRTCQSGRIRATRKGSLIIARGGNGHLPWSWPRHGGNTHPRWSWPWPTAWRRQQHRAATTSPRGVATAWLSLSRVPRSLTEGDHDFTDAPSSIGVAAAASHMGHPSRGPVPHGWHL